MKAKNWSSTIATGFAMFSMFFGAGNVVFPLTVGQYAQSLTGFAMLGLFVTAIGVPFLGLTAMTLFDGDYKQFFYRVGKAPGFAIATIILLLIGPFGAAPRCITLSYATLKYYIPDISLLLFSAISILIIFAMTIRRSKILDILGYVLTPILLVSLGIIIVMGWIYAPALPESGLDKGHVFMMGLTEGYQTMDLLGAFFFSSVVLACLRDQANPADMNDYKQLIRMTLRAGFIGMGLLAVTYLGFSYISAFYSNVLTDVAPDQLAGALAVQILGPYAGIIACLAVSLSCLTTAIALCSVSAEFIHIDLSRNKISYGVSLIITLIATFFVSTLDFSGIKLFLLPILVVCYPALILLSVLNLLHKLYRFEWVKSPVAVVFVLSLAGFLLT